MPTELETRIAQLTGDGLIDYYRCARLSKHEVFPRMPVPRPPPLVDAVRCDKGFAARHAGVSGEVPASGVFVFEDSFVGKSGTILDQDRKVRYDDDLISSYWMWFLGKFIKRAIIEKQSRFRHLITDFIAGRDVPVRTLDADGATVIVLAKSGFNVYGHWLLDVLPMTFHFFQALRSGSIRGPFKFLLADGVPKWAYRLLELLFDIKREDVITFDQDREIVRAKRLVVPSLLRVSPLISPRMNDFVDHVYDRIGGVNASSAYELPRRVYVSRASIVQANRPDQRVLLGRREVLETMTTMGLTPLAPERLPWADQVRLFANAELVAGEYGSGMHNMLLSPASTVGVVLANTGSNWNQSAIAGLRRQRLVFVKPAHEEPHGTANQIAFRYDNGDMTRALAAARSCSASSRRSIG